MLKEIKISHGVVKFGSVNLNTMSDKTSNSDLIAIFKKIYANPQHFIGSSYVGRIIK